MTTTAFDRSTPRLIFGIAVIMVGVLFTLDNMGFKIAATVWKAWPLILIALGVPNIGRPSASEKFSGFLLVTIGVLLLIRNFGFLHFSLISLWPLILVAAGVRLVLNAIQQRHGFSDASSMTDTLDEWAAFGGVEKQIQSTSFRGGSLSAFCGGLDIDLRNAGITQSPATINVFAFCGGAEIRVPRTWDVTISVLPILGGSDDKTVHPALDAMEGPPQKLVVTGLAMMGGISIKN